MLWMISFSTDKLTPQKNCYLQFTCGKLRLRQVRTQSHTGRWQSHLSPQACCLSSGGPHILGATPSFFLSPPCTLRSKSSSDHLPLLLCNLRLPLPAEQAPFPREG